MFSKEAFSTMVIKCVVTAQLIDALYGRHLWADQYDRKIEDLFAVQDEISRKVFVELHVVPW